MKILPGGIDSGLKHVMPTVHEPRLIQFKGKLSVQSVPVTPVLASSLNHGDAFVLDIGNMVYIWRGAHSKHTEKFAALSYAEKIKSDRQGKTKIETLEDSGCEEFWAVLKGGIDQVKSEAEGGDDEKGLQKVRKLFKLSDASGTMQMTKVLEAAAIPKSALQSDDVFILDTSVLIYVWVGKGASNDERRLCIPRTQVYMETNGIAASVPIIRELDGSETSDFLTEFTN